MLHPARSQWVRRYAASLTPQRLKGQAIVLAAGLWITAAYTLSTTTAFDRNGILKGIDFLQFYTAAQIVSDGDGQRLYDWTVFAERLRRAVPGTGDLLFLSVYPPQLALALAPLGRLSYFGALAAWAVVSILLYALCCHLISREFPEWREPPVAWWLLALTFVPFQQVILHGQVGVLVLACFTGAWVALRQHRLFQFGLLLGAVCFKPPFLLAALAAAVLTRSARVVAGVAVGTVSQLLTVAIILGPDIWLDYLEKVLVLLRAPDMFEPKLWQMHSLKGFWQLLLGTGTVASALWAGTAIVALGAAAYVWRRTDSPDLRMSALVIVTVLVSPHLYIYDLVVIAVALAALARWLLGRAASPAAPTIRVLMHLVWWAPLIGPFAVLTRIQVTPIVLGAVLWTMVSTVRSSDAPAQSTVRPESV
jgi:hypothetical protein